MPPSNIGDHCAVFKTLGNQLRFEVVRPVPPSRNPRDHVDALKFISTVRCTLLPCCIRRQAGPGQRSEKKRSLWRSTRRSSWYTTSFSLSLTLGRLLLLGATLGLLSSLLLLNATLSLLHCLLLLGSALGLLSKLLLLLSLTLNCLLLLLGATLGLLRRLLLLLLSLTLNRLFLLLGATLSLLRGLLLLGASLSLYSPLLLLDSALSHFGRLVPLTLSFCLNGCSLRIALF